MGRIIKRYIRLRSSNDGCYIGKSVQRFLIPIPDSRSLRKKWEKDFSLPEKKCDCTESLPRSFDSFRLIFFFFFLIIYYSRGVAIFVTNVSSISCVCVIMEGMNFLKSHFGNKKKKKWWKRSNEEAINVCFSTCTCVFLSLFVILNVCISTITLVRLSYNIVYAIF